VESQRVSRLPFEDPDPSFIPLAGRRALDRAGLRLSLRAWQGLSLLVRETVARLGEDEEVDEVRVRELLEGAHPEPESIEPLDDPPLDAVPPAISDALGAGRPIDPRRWRALSPVGRYALSSYARRGRAEKLAEAYDALVGP
jgi:hypothetical protein